MSLFQQELYNKVKSAILSCDTNLFVFDELHEIPMGLLDVLIPILENHDISVDSRYLYLISSYNILWALLL